MTWRTRSSSFWLYWPDLSSCKGSHRDRLLNIIKRAWNWTLSRFFRRLADAHRHFGNLYSKREEYQAAVSNYTRAIHRDPTYADAYYSRGVLYWRELRSHQLAIEDLTRVLALEPSQADAYFNRALAYKMEQDHARAIADFERYLEEGTDEFWLDAARRQLAELRDETTDGFGT
jgi:tetratricopeptide (TPR) repeat protein